MDDIRHGRFGRHAHRITVAGAAGVPIAIAALAASMLRTPIMRLGLLLAIALGTLFGLVMVRYRRQRSSELSPRDPWIAAGPEPSVDRDIRFLIP